MKAKDWIANIAALAGIGNDPAVEQKAIREAEAAAAEQGGTLLVKPAAPIIAALKAAYPWLHVRQDANLCVRHMARSGSVNERLLSETFLYPPAFTLTADTLDSLDKKVCESVDTMLGLVEVDSADELKDWYFYMVFDRVSEVSLKDNDGNETEKQYSASVALVAVHHHQVDCSYSYDPQSSSMKLFGAHAEEIAPEEIERRVHDKNLSDPAQCTSVVQEIMTILSDVHRKV